MMIKKDPFPLCSWLYLGVVNKTKVSKHRQENPKNRIARPENIRLS
jgi:hypothetical protein